MLFGMAVHFDTFANEVECSQNGSEGEMRPRLTLRVSRLIIHENTPNQTEQKHVTVRDF